jgi:hypothetical protein
MEIYDESLIKIMSKDDTLRERGVTEDMLEQSLIRAMKYLESKRIDNYKIQNAILNQERTKKAALIAEKQVKELIENSQNIKKRL